jgi:hypothetical protein
MNYFTYISYWYSPKNKLEAAIHEYLRKEERKIIPATEINAFRTRIYRGIMCINGMFPRCHPVTVAWRTETKAGNAKYWYPDILLDVNNFSICQFKMFVQRADQKGGGQ